MLVGVSFFFFQAEDGIRDLTVTGVQTCALPISCGAGKAAACEELGNRLQEGLGVRGGEGRAAQLFRKRSGEGRGGEEGRIRGAADPLKKKKSVVGCWEEGITRQMTNHSTQHYQT